MKLTLSAQIFLWSVFFGSAWLFFKLVEML